MKKFFIDLAISLMIVKPCPSCVSAWTGGRLNPEYIKWCPLCGPGPAGWIWGTVVPKFIQQIRTKRRISEYKAIVEHIENQSKIEGKEI